jgi:8-oxo-dGTP pyrophosphatase MutT (NUDIX family)
MTLEPVLAHPDVARLARALEEYPGVPEVPGPHARQAAIALILRIGSAGDPELLMIKRAELERDPWSGHVACPGGRMEEGDADLAATAIREAREETGIDLRGDGHILGTLDDLSPQTPVLPPLVIRPFVAVVRPEVVVIQSPEVAEAFWIPLEQLRAEGAWAMRTVLVRGFGERTVSTFRHGGHVVWGLTERVLRQLLERLGW